jgi:hypothetical protein
MTVSQVNGGGRAASQNTQSARGIVGHNRISHPAVGRMPEHPAHPAELLIPECQQENESNRVSETDSNHQPSIINRRFPGMHGL